MLKKLFSIGLLFLLVGYSSLFADLNSTKKMIDSMSHKYRNKLSKQYLKLLYGLDSYFCDNKDLNISYYKELRKKNSLVIVFSLKDNTRFNIHLRGHVALPQLKNKLELTFSQDDDKEIDNQSAITKNDDVISDKKLHVGLKYYLYREKLSSAYGKLSFKVHSPFGPYLKFGIDKRKISSDFLSTEFNNALYYYLNGNDLSASTAVSFYKYLNNEFSIGQGNKLYWTGKKAIYLNNTILLDQFIDLNNRIVYKADFTTSYDSLHEFRQDNFSLSIGYHHRFDKWFFLEIIPKFRKEQENSYNSEYLISVNIGVRLGH